MDALDVVFKKEDLKEFLTLLEQVLENSPSSFIPSLGWPQSLDCKTLASHFKYAYVKEPKPYQSIPLHHLLMKKGRDCKGSKRKASIRHVIYMFLYAF